MSAAASVDNSFRTPHPEAASSVSPQVDKSAEVEQDQKVDHDQEVDQDQGVEPAEEDLFEDQDEEPACCCIRVCQAIAQCVQAIFQCIADCFCCCCAGTETLLSEEDLEILQQFEGGTYVPPAKSKSRLQEIPGSSPAVPRNLEQEFVAQGLGAAPVVEEPEVPEDQLTVEGLTRRHITDLTKTFATHVSNITFKRYLKDRIKKYQASAEKLPNDLKENSPFVVSIFGKVEELLTKSLEQFHVAGTTDTVQHQSLLWLLRNAFDPKSRNLEQFHKSVMARVNAEVEKAEPIAARTKLNKNKDVHVKNCFTWLEAFYKTKKAETPFAAVGGNKDHRLHEIVQNAIFAQLIDDKISEFFKRLEDVRVGALDTVEDVLATSLQLVAKEIGNRVTDLLENLPNFKEEFIDKAIIETFSDHLGEVAKANTYAKNVLKKTPASATEGDRKRLEEIRSRAQEKPEEAVEQLRQLYFREKLNPHRHVKKVFELSGKQFVTYEDLQEHLKSIAFYDQLAEQIIRLILPSSHSTDGLTLLWQKIKERVAGKFKSISTVLEFTDGLLAPDIAAPIKDLYDGLYKMGEHHFLEKFVRDKLRTQISEFLREQFIEQLSHPERLKELMVQSILPSIRDTFLQMTANQALMVDESKALIKLAPDFVKLVELGDDEKARQEQIGKILDKWKQAFKAYAKDKKCVESLKKENDDRLDQLLLLNIKEFESVLSAIHERHKTNHERFDATVAKNVLEEFMGGKTGDYPDEEIDLYWQMIEQLIFNVAGEKNLGKGTLEARKKKIITGMLDGFSVYRSSHNGMTRVAAGVIKEKFATKAFLLNLFKSIDESMKKGEADKKGQAAAAPSPVKSKSDEERKEIHSVELESKEAAAGVPFTDSDLEVMEADQKAKAGIVPETMESLVKQVAEMAFANIATTIDKATSFGGAARWWSGIGSDSSNLEATITSVIESGFGNGILNASLVITLQERIFAAFEESAKCLREAEALKRLSRGGDDASRLSREFKPLSPEAPKAAAAADARRFA